MSVKQKYIIEFDSMVQYVKNLDYDLNKIQDRELINITIGVEEAIKNEKILLAGKILYCKKGYIRILAKMLYKEYVKWILKYCTHS